MIFLGGRGGARRAMTRRWWLISALLIVAAVPTSGQTFQFLPEINTYFRLTSNVRVYFQAKETREGGDPTQAELGPSIEFHFKPLIQLRGSTEFDPDPTKKRVLVLAIGYRYIPSPSAPTINRLRVDLASHIPMKGKILISDRSRGDLDWQSGQFTWRYRNRLTIQRTVAIRSYHLIPYVSAEPFYESQYGKWADTALYAGCLFPVRKRVEFDSYYEHQNNTGKNPDQVLNQFGLVLNLYLELR
jgi:Protein of unknown function (DUF2490)